MSYSVLAQVREYPTAATPRLIEEAIDELLESADSLIAKAQSAEANNDEDAYADCVRDFGKLMGNGDDAGGQLAELYAIEKVATAKLHRKKAAAVAQFEKSPREPYQIEVAGMSAELSLPNYVAPTMKAFKNDDRGVQSAWVAGNWWKALNCRLRGAPDERAERICDSAGVTVLNSMTEGTATAGGYLVPQPLAAAIIQFWDQHGVIRRAARPEVMTSETKDVPKLSGGLTVYYPGEGGEFTSSDESWGQVNLVAKKRGILTKVSRELRDDAIISVIDQLAFDMGNTFALKQDSEGIDGDGTSTYGGEVGLLASIGAGGVSTAATGHDTWAEIDLADVTAWMSLLPSKHSPGASIICSLSFYTSVLLRILANGGGNTMVSLAQGVEEGMFLGRRVLFTDYMPTTSVAATVCALYGNFSNAMILGSRQDIEIAISDQRYFEQDLIGVRGVSRYDLNVHEPGTASVAGAYVALKTAA